MTLLSPDIFFCRERFLNRDLDPLSTTDSTGLRRPGSKGRHRLS